MAFTIHRAVELTRQVWNYAKADWDLLRDSLDEVNWDLFRSLKPNECAKALTEQIIELADHRALAEQL